MYVDRNLIDHWKMLFESGCRRDGVGVTEDTEPDDEEFTDDGMSETMEAWRDVIEDEVALETALEALVHLLDAGKASLGDVEGFARLSHPSDSMKRGSVEKLLKYLNLKASVKGAR